MESELSVVMVHIIIYYLYFGEFYGLSKVFIMVIFDRKYIIFED